MALALKTEVERLIIETGLYQKFIPSDVPHHAFAVAIIYTAYTINCHCVNCDTTTTFRHQGEYNYENQRIRHHTGKYVHIPEIYEHFAPGVKELSLCCTHQHCQSMLKLYMIYTNYSIIKIGQFPSVVDLQQSMLSAGSKLLDMPFGSYLRTALNLHTHGNGMGAYVYLRRIFEELIRQEYETHKENHGVIAGFEGLKVADKIKALEDRLPQFMVEQRVMYSHLSLGIHELEEDKCKEFFPLLLDGIQEILEQRREQKEKEARAKARANGIQSIGRQISGGGE